MAKRAILVIDMINDFVVGKYGSEGAKRIVPILKIFLNCARVKKIPIIYVQDTHNPKDPELKIWGRHALKGTQGCETVRELSPGPKDILIEKNTFSGFYKTKLEHFLKKLRVKELILTGVTTDICVKHAAADGFFRGYKLTVASDCCAALSDEDHRSALEYMKRVYRAKIIDSRNLIHLVGGKGRKAIMGEGR